MRPPGLAPSFEECSVDAQALILAFDQIKSIEENEKFELELKVAGAKF